MDYGSEERRSYGGSRFGGGRGGGRGGYGNGGGFDNRRSFSPVKEGEELNSVIEAVAEKGDGIAKKSGFVIFVPGTKVGDKVKIRVKKVAKKVAFAEVIGPYDESGATSEPKPAPAEEQQETQAEEQEAEEPYDASQDSEEF